ARLDAGTRRELHDIVVDDTDDDPSVLLERWAARAGLEEHARVDAPFIVGWCSWYHYFDAVTEKDVFENLARARADAWPFDVFQIDDGYQRAIGDWLQTNEKFPSEIDALAAAIAAAGRTPGIWLAPFLAAPTAELTHAHPEWLARAPNDGGFAIGGYGDAWGGVMAELDTTNPEVLDHLQATASAMVSAGFRYLKLDFTYSAAMPGRYADPTRTPAERVRAGYEAIRRGAGDDVFILGCGAPLGAVVGVVDGMRIGPDVAPWWDPPPDAAEQQPAYELTTPATRHAFLGTCARSFMHRRLWSNDPDCVMLRTTATRLAPSAADAWARTVGASGGMVLVSDDPAAVEPAGRRLLDEVVADGRAADDAARRGDSPRAVGLLDPGGPRGLSGPAVSVTLDLPGGEAATTVRAIRSRPR
ncbi:MAG TPA: glycoside hydrolase family 36 protein, partial [Acidimicrobiia bacterium]|nr:glycoside hydrolase family 36 protein [Acidimicrobiia bacterium]